MNENNDIYYYVQSMIIDVFHSLTINFNLLFFLFDYYGIINIMKRLLKVEYYYVNVKLEKFYLFFIFILYFRIFLTIYIYLLLKNINILALYY